jgi:transcriptional regulator with XRE-family HTH domain
MGEDGGVESIVEKSLAVRIGARVRELRRRRGLSLSELAVRAGVGKATLSGVEAGTRNPTLETLYSIAGQLGVPLADVIAEPGKVRGPVEIAGGDAVTGTLLEVFEDPRVVTELYSLRIRAGRVQTSPPHPPGTTEHLTVFVGAVRVGPPDASVLVEEGGHFVWAADVPHIYVVEGQEEVRASLLIRQPRHPA